jgi:hypothetical protein
MFFWVFPRRHILVCRRFGTYYQFYLQRLDVEYEVVGNRFMTVFCHADGFGLLLAKLCDSIASLTPSKQNHSLYLSAYINRTAVL